jgi:hypothetical protein
MQSFIFCLSMLDDEDEGSMFFSRLNLSIYGILSCNIRFYKHSWQALVV